MTARAVRRGALAIAMSVLMASPLHAADAPDVATDPAGAWATFLRDGDNRRVAEAFEAYRRIGYADGVVDGGDCETEAAALAAAVAIAPVSIALRRVEMHCAEARGDDAGADRALAALSSLSRHALSGAPGPSLSRPIRVARFEDIDALLSTMGVEPAYAFHALRVPERHFPTIVAVLDVDAGTERLLAFDLVDTWTAIERADPYRAFPLVRNRLARALLAAEQEGSAQEGVDHAAWEAAWRAGDVPAKLAALKPGVEAGGIQSLRTWLGLCIQAPSPTCGDGLVDALLPLAEQRQGIPMALLALAYHQGIGLPRDAVAAERMLVAADRRLPPHGGTVEVAALLAGWSEAPLPDDLRARLRTAAVAGDASALVLLAGMAGADADDAAERLSALAGAGFNNDGRVEWVVAIRHHAAGRKAEAREWTRRAALKGNDRARMAHGSALLNGDGVAPDRAEGERFIELSAPAGLGPTSRWLASKAERGGRFGDAENWLMPAVWSGDVDAQLDLGWLALAGEEGVDTRPEAGLSLLRAVAGDGNARARRMLADAAFEGRGMPKDVPAARRALEVLAKAGDEDAGLTLAGSYLIPDDGEPDEAAARRWLAPMLAKDLPAAHRILGDWLVMRKGGRAARTEGFAHWEKAIAGGDRWAINNAAWESCISGEPSERETGRAMLTRLLAIDGLSASQLDTVAACHARLGEFPAAIAAQERAIATLADDDDAGDADTDVPARFRERLALYRAGRPYVDEDTAERMRAD